MRMRAHSKQASKKAIHLSHDNELSKDYRRPRKLKVMQRWKKRMRQTTLPWRVVLVGLTALLLVRYALIRPFGHLIFDSTTMHGGELGRMADTLGRTLIFRRTMQRRNLVLTKLGIQLPPMKDVINKKGIPNLPQASLAEILVRSKIRTRQLQIAEMTALHWSTDCREQPTIPNHVLQPDHGDFFRPVHAPGLDVIRWDHYSMRKLIQDRFPALLQKFDKCIDKSEQTLLWSLCALYTYGGSVFGRNYRAVDSYLDGVFGVRGGCRPIGVFLFDGASTADHSLETVFMVATPRHSYLNRILETLTNNATKALSDSWLLELLRGENARDPSDLFDGLWDVLTCNCSAYKVPQEDACCQTIERGHPEKLSLNSDEHQSASTILPPKVYLKVLNTPKLVDSSDGVGARFPVEVIVWEGSDTISPPKTSKASVQDRLESLKCSAGWLCNRCLRNALFGTHAKCRFICPSCYEMVICSRSEGIPKKHVSIDVSVRETRPLAPGEQRIPRIIHQTWFEEPTVDRYPQLARLQNSWRNTGWEYRFYTDSTMREYIADNYPPRFLDAFDSLIPGAFKADFFRYLVLLKDGGVYADVDILLDINLDSFITPSMSFFVPRDIVGDYANENFCLWNGLIGASPGHPFMARAVEALLTNVLNRFDYYDMERDMCHDLGSTGEVWKLRALTILSLSGPCLLGQAVNKALGRSGYLSKYDTGWMTPTRNESGIGIQNDVGDALLLIASRADMGALRFSDVDRNMIVASTGMTELSKDPILAFEDQLKQASEVEASHLHYSSFEHANDVFGADSIYVDNLVTNEWIRVKISH